jgi:beta-glucosidase-like glycosyl hydrolase
VTRTTLQKMKAGAFDPVGPQSEWTSLGLQDLNSTAHQQVAYEAALQSLVLLKNGATDLEVNRAAAASVVVGGTGGAGAAVGAVGAGIVAGAPPLPLQRGKKLAVVGPLAFETTGLVSDYASWHMNDKTGRCSLLPTSAVCGHVIA